MALLEKGNPLVRIIIMTDKYKTKQKIIMIKNKTRKKKTVLICKSTLAANNNLKGINILSK
jgi:hypothetical protein